MRGWQGERDGNFLADTGFCSCSADFCEEGVTPEVEFSRNFWF